MDDNKSESRTDRRSVLKSVGMGGAGVLGFTGIDLESMTKQSEVQFIEMTHVARDASSDLPMIHTCGAAEYLIHDQKGRLSITDVMSENNTKKFENNDLVAWLSGDYLSPGGESDGMIITKRNRKNPIVETGYRNHTAKQVRTKSKYLEPAIRLESSSNGEVLINHMNKKEQLMPGDSTSIHQGVKIHKPAGSTHQTDVELTHSLEVINNGYLDVYSQ